MSDIFDSGEGNQTEPTNENNQENPLDVLVGDNKKFKSVEDLARGKLESDRYIEQLKQALEEASDELKQNDSAKALLEELRSRKQTQASTTKNSETSGNSGSNVQRETSGEVSEDRIQRLVEQTLTDREKQRTAVENRRVAVSTLEQKLGDKAGEFLVNKATELGLSKERLGEMAAESPTAFFRLIGLDSTPKDETRPHSQVRSEGLKNQNTTGERTNAYYINLRRTNRSEYYRPSTQAQMYKDRDRLGDKFWE